MNTTCPFCNAVVAIPTSASGRIPCTRCGESFPLGPAAAQQATASAAVAQLPRAPSAALRRSNRQLAGVVFAAMLFLAVAATVYMLSTRSKRGMASLAESPALRYLPADANVIAAVNVPVAESSKTGLQMLERLGLQPGGRLDLERLCGLRTLQIEEAVIGLKIDANLIPKFWLVVRTRQSYDADRLREKLGRQRSRTEGNKTLDLVKPPGLPVEVVLWCATSRTLILSLTAEDMAKVPDQPAENLEHLPPPLLELLSYRSDRDTFFWLVAHAEMWEKTALGLMLRLPDEERKLVFRVQTLGVGFRNDSGTTTSRRRPARITEETRPGEAGVALDLVLRTRGADDTAEVRTAFEDWVDRLRLELKSSELNDVRYSATVSGSVTEWEAVWKSISDRPANKK